MSNNILTSYLGLNLNNTITQIKRGQLTYALNANLQSLDGNALTYTNDHSNQICINFPEGYVPIGIKNIIEKNEIIFLLTNIKTGGSEIGKVTNFNCNNITTDNVEYNCNCKKGIKLESNINKLEACCKYETLINNDCLNFDINYPIRITYKLTNCGYRIYFVDKLNGIRFIDLNNPLGNDACNNPNQILDCRDLKLFKDFCIPEINPFSVEGNGNIRAGVYQGLIAYTDKQGNEFTDYFYSTNPIPIYDRKITIDTDYFTNKSIKFKIKHNTDVFDYFKFVIIETVNEVSKVLEVGVFKVNNNNFVNYTGNDKTLKASSFETIRISKPNYTNANLIDNSSGHLIIADLEGDPEYNFQPFVNKLKLYWETIAVPYNDLNNYSNPIVSSKFRSYMRDEVYPFAIRFKLKSGKTTKAYHIPGRLPITLVNNNSGYNPDFINIFPDDQIIKSDNKDNIQYNDCEDPEDKKRWEVYNTGFSLSLIPSTNNDDKICDIFPLERGEFSYWESTELYPCDEKIWGDLAGKPIRHFKFPDSTITHIHDKWNDIQKGEYDISHNSFIYPIGVRLDESTFNSLILDDNFNKIYNPKTKEKDLNISDLICGFEIVRGNRVNNKSVIAKGLLYDVGKYTDSFSKKDYYFPNYPYNDLNSDSFLGRDESIYNTPDLKNDQNYYLNAFDNEIKLSGNNRFTFHSPDIHFQQPQLGTELKIETEEFGVCRGHFVKVDNHPKYKFLTKFDSVISTALGIVSSVNISNSTEDELDASVTGGIRNRRNGKIDVNYAELISTTNIVKDTIEKLIPLRNFAYQYNSIGVYNNYDKIPNDTTNQWKRRKIEIGRYLSSNNQFVQDDKPVNNFQRESCVYLKTNLSFKSYNREEFSRYSLSHAGNIPLLTDYNEWCKHPEHEKDSKIRSFYASIKRNVPDQYGNIDSISYIHTGYSITLKDNMFEQTYYPIFGGDIFINKFSLKRKMPFFVQNMVGRPDQIDFDYDLVPNVAYPLYYISTSPDELKLQEIIKDGEIGALLLGVFSAIGGNMTSGITSQAFNAIATTLIIGAGSSIYLNILNGFIPKNNLDCDTTPSSLSSSLGVSTKDINIDLGPLGSIDFRIPNGINLNTNPEGGDVSNPTLFYQSGKFYLAAYGIPQFFVESDINLEFRHGRNELEENYHSTNNSSIPDDWLQEKNVPILHDNKFNYNATYSLQNYQEFIESFNNSDFDKACQSIFPNRIIYSEKSNNEENFDNWFKFSANNYYDFDKTKGKLIGIDSLDNNRILLRFENSFQIFNTRITLQSNSPYEIEISNSGMFTQDPIEMSKTNTGIGGSQHTTFEKTPIGYSWVDAKRGEWYIFNNQLEEISRSNYNWFKENLPFKILEDFPNYNIDNSFKDVGLSLCWDERFERLFLTKKDYKIRDDRKSQVFLIENKTFVRYELDLAFVISLDDPEYFENKSFTVSWSPLIKNIVSFHSFLPDYYISHPTHFQTGIKGSLWNHGLSNLNYQVYYNNLYPYIIEFPDFNIPQQEICKSVSVNLDIYKYINESDYYSLKSVNNENYNIFFNKAIIYNKEQCSGLLTLTESPINNLFLKKQFPIHNTSDINILYSKNNGIYTFNTFYDITRNYNNGQPIFSTNWNDINQSYPIDKVLNIDNINYNNNMKKTLIKSNYCYIRLINDIHDRYKFINQFTLIQNQ